MRLIVDDSGCLCHAHFALAHEIELTYHDLESIVQSKRRFKLSQLNF